MFSLEIFTELLVVGMLLLLGISPLLLLVNKNHGRSEFWPLTGNFDSKIKVVIILILAYAAGAAGNRLVDDFWEDVVGFEYERKYEKLLQESLKSNARFGVSQMSINCHGYVADQGDCIKVVQLALRERSEATRQWLDNRRAYVRLMRAASLAALLFIITMGVHKFRGKAASGYKFSHLALALLFFAALTLGHWLADSKYWKRVFELYLALPEAGQVSTGPRQ